MIVITGNAFALSRIVTVQLRLLVVAVVCIATNCLPAQAQELRIATRVRQLPGTSNPGDKPRLVASSLTLFHHGKVYDYIDSAGEVIVFEPRQNRFTILNESRSLSADVNFDEVKKLLKVSKKETTEYVRQQRALLTRSARETADALAFQLEPEFKQRFDKEKELLTLSSPAMRYEVTCGTHRDAKTREAILNWMDWMARLNHVLHPHAMRPDARILLNKALGEHERIPLKVELHARMVSELDLEAEHQISWELIPYDRSLITRWENMLKSDTIRSTTFRRYQEVVVQTAAN